MRYFRQKGYKDRIIEYFGHMNELGWIEFLTHVQHF